MEDTIEGTSNQIKGKEGDKRQRAHTPQSLDKAQIKKVVNQYFAERKGYQEVANYELGLRAAFQNMLASVAKQIGWSLAPEMTLGKIRPDGVVLDEWKLRRGYWEAKGPEINLEREIAKKIENKYPLTNTIFEDSKTAILYQNKKRFSITFKLHTPNDVSDLLQQFFTYVEPDIENFEEAVDEFKERIPEHAQALLDIIREEHKLNTKFRAAFLSFVQLCQDSIDPQMDDPAINEMLVQHLLTERLFRTVFNNPDFVRRNVIAVEIEKVIDALASRSFNRTEFLKKLDRFYVAIEQAARGIESWSERQEFLNTVYERFFQGFAVKQADTHGIVYTPQEIVDFMVESVDVVLKQEFGKSIETLGVRILDPATGTGNFIVNIIRRLYGRTLKEKYANDLFCNEIMLLPYYIASLNIEHAYYEQMQQYEPFEGICFADTLEMAEGRQLQLFVEENTTRVKREKETGIMVVIGNPPYNVGQKNENDNNKNRKYPVVDAHIKETYAKDSKATLKNQLYDAYVRFFRWATDRLHGCDGIVCLVTNNSFIDQIAFDGIRSHLQKDFTQIYHLDLHGNVRKNPKLSGTTHNVFGIQVGVGITIAVRSSQHSSKAIYYSRVPEYWRKSEKLRFLAEKANLSEVEWTELKPDSRYNWINDGFRTEFVTFLPLETKTHNIGGIFEASSVGVNSSRDTIVYNFNRYTLSLVIERFIADYNSEVFRWKTSGCPKDIDQFVNYKNIKWSEHLKKELKREKYGKKEIDNFKVTLYRPFGKRWLYHDALLNDRPGSFDQIFPNRVNTTENCCICVTMPGSEKPFMTLATLSISDYHLVGAGAGTQCFPFYTYSGDGTNRRENITDWALKQFQTKYGEQASKWDIFHYVYAMLHHPQYRELYKENLKRDLPHIPLIVTEEAFATCVRVGRQLMTMHVQYETEEEYPLREVYNREVPYEQSLRVEKMKLSSDKTTLIYSKGLTLEGIPQDCFEYRLGNRSALEWVIDQYQVSTDKRSGIESDPNRLDDPEYIVRLLKQVVMLSVKTVELVNELAEAVHDQDWINQ